MAKAQHKSYMVDPSALACLRMQNHLHLNEQKSTADCEHRAAEQFKNSTEQYNKHAKPLLPIPIGTSVRIQDPVPKRWNRVSTVMGRGLNRDYLIKTAARGVLWRNSRFFRTIAMPDISQDNSHHFSVPPANYPDNTGGKASQSLKSKKTHPPPRQSPRLACHP